MSSSSFKYAAILFVAGTVTTALLADPPTKQKRNRKADETLVFVTGSLIPQRVKVQRIGTKTMSPHRVIDRTEIDQNGRPTTAGALINDPAVQVISR